MGALIRRTFAVLPFVCLAFLLFPAHAAAQKDGTVGFFKAPVSDPVASGESATVSLYTYYTPPEGGYGGPTFSNLTWTWSVSGAPGVDADTSSDAANPTLNIKVSPPGNYSIALKVTATWDVSTGGTVSASEAATLDLSVVGVQKLQYMVSKGVYADITSVMYVQVGQTLIFKAVSTPDEATYPKDNPVWSGTAGAKGTGDTVGVTFSTVSKSAADFKTVTATCGDTYETASVLVYDAPAPYVPVTVIATDGTFSPDLAPIETEVTTTLSAKAVRPSPEYPATIGSPT
jgi:hypothetical protein